MTEDRRAAPPVDQAANLIRIYKDRWSAAALAEHIFDLALEEAAKVAEAHRGTWEEEEAAAKIIAAAIRALKGKP